MAQCVTTAAVSDTSGTTQTVLVVDTSSTAPACSTGLALVSSSDLEALAASASNPLNLSTSDGLLVAVAVCGVWFIGWGWRALGRVLSSNGEALD